MNTFKTIVLMIALLGLGAGVGAAIGSVGGLIVGAVISFLVVGLSYWFSDKLAIASARAEPVTEEQLPRYYGIMQELTDRADMPMPKLYVSPNPQPNAFATGRNPNHAAVAITEGLINHLTWDEIRGVLAHELAHIRNRDILIGSMAAAIAMTITFASRLVVWGMIFFGRGRDRSTGDLISTLALAILAPIAAAMLQMAISRTREFKADASAARLIGDGEPLARALEKLQAGTHQIPVEVPSEQASHYIANPLGGRRSGFSGLFSTHPPMEERIRRLRAGEWAPQVY